MLYSTVNAFRQPSYSKYVSSNRVSNTDAGLILYPQVKTVQSAVDPMRSLMPTASLLRGGEN